MVSSVWHLVRKVTSIIVRDTSDEYSDLSISQAMIVAANSEGQPQAPIDFKNSAFQMISTSPHGHTPNYASLKDFAASFGPATNEHKTPGVVAGHTPRKNYTQIVPAAASAKHIATPAQATSAPAPR